MPNSTSFDRYRKNPWMTFWLAFVFISGLASSGQAQSFTANQVAVGSDCNWPFNAVATNPVDGKVYGFWRKNAGAAATYSLIRFDGSSWTTLSSFTVANISFFDSATDDVSLAIDASGSFHVAFRGSRGGGINSTRGVGYGYSATGTSWTFTEIETFSDPNGWKNTDDPVIQVDAQNHPHIAFRFDDVNGNRLHAIHYFSSNGSSWSGGTAFSQTGASNEVTEFDLALDGTGKAHIAFQRETNGSGLDGGLWYTNNTSGSWSSPQELAHGDNNGQTFGYGISIDTDAANKVHIVHSDGDGHLLYLNNVSGSFTGGQINGNLTGYSLIHSFVINSNGDRFVAYADNGLKYAYLLAGASGNWTTGTAYTIPSGVAAGTFASATLSNDRRIMYLFDRATNSNGACNTFTRDLWYATATLPGPPVNAAVSSINTTSPSPTNAASINFTVTFDKSVAGVGASNFSLTTSGVSGASVASVSGSGTTRTVAVNTGSGSGTIRLDMVNAAGVTPSVTNVPFTSGTTVTIDKTGPAVSSVAVPANGTYLATQNLNFTINFNGNVIVTGTPQLALTIGATMVQANYVSGSGTNALLFNYTVQSGQQDTDGVTVGNLTLNGGTLKDGVGNDASLTLTNIASTANVKVDAVAPTVSSVAVPANGTYLATQNLDFTINFSENVTVTGTPQLALTIGATIVQANYVSGSGSTALVFRYTVLTGQQDTDGVSVGSLGLNGGTLKDGAGNTANLTLNSVASTAGVNVDAVAPTVNISSSAGSNGGNTGTSPIPFSLLFSETVTGLTTGEITVTNGTVSGFSGSGTTYSFNVTPVANGLVTVNLAANVAQDAAGNGNTAAPQFSITYTQPVTSGPSITSPANGTRTNVTTISVTGTAPANSLIRLYNASDNSLIDSQQLASGATNWSISVPLTSNATTTVYAKAQLSGQVESAASSSVSIIQDATAPTVTSVSVPGNGIYRASQPLSFTVNFAENVTVAGTPQLPLTIGSTNRQASYVGGSGSSQLVFTYVVQTDELDTDGIGLASALTLNGGTIKDAANNDATLTLNNVGSTVGVLVDAVVPTVSLSSSAGPSGSSTSTSPVDFTVTFSESVTGLVSSELNVTGGTLSGFSGSGTTYTFTVTPPASGLITVNLAANVAQDAAGNGNTAASQFSINYQPVTSAPAVSNPTNGMLTADNTPTYTGTAPATSTVTVYVDGSSVGTTTATGGNWSFTQPTSLVNSNHTVYATAQLSGYAVSPTSNTVTFTVDNSTLSLALSAVAVCSNSPLSLTATAMNIGTPVTYSLSSNPAGFAGSGPSPKFNLTAPSVVSPTTYTLTVAATSNAGNASATAVITVNPLPTVSLTNLANSYCKNASDAALTGTPTGGLFTVDGTVATSFSPSSLSVGQHTVVYSYTNGNGCSATPSQFVTVNPLPTPTLVANGTLTCAQTSISLTAGGGTTYQFSGPGSINQSGNTATVNAPGTYSVTVTDGNGCAAVTSVQVFQDITLPTPSLTASTLTTVNQPISVTTSGCSGTLNWQVQGGSGQANGAIYTVSAPGTYTITTTCTVGSCISPAAPAVVLTIQAPNTSFAITSVNMVNCYKTNPSRGEYTVQFTPHYSGQNSNPISFSVVNELPSTTDPAPYTLRLYDDNPVITLVANQAGNGEARFVYNWLASCSTGNSPNQAPTTVGIGAQTLTLNQPYQLNLSSYFTDPEGQTLTYAAQGLPAGLTVSGSLITGTPSQTGTFGVTITAIDPGNLSVSTNVNFTVQTQPISFAIVGVTPVSCEVIKSDQRRVRFTPQYNGLTGQPITFRVVNELPPTTQAGPYSLDLYTDNPIIELRAIQDGTAGEVSFSYNWLAACGSTPVNAAPKVTQPIPNQTGAVNQAFNYPIPAGTFTDPDGDALVLTASGLPAGLSLTGSVISGTPSVSGVSTVVITATDPGNLSVSTNFVLTINQVTIPPDQVFAIKGVNLLNCLTVTAQQRLIRFSPQYNGLTGQPISFSVVNEMPPTTAGGPYELQLYTDNPVIVLKASQAGTAGEASFSYNWLAACNAPARQSAEKGAEFSVQVLGNPVVGERVEVLIRGADQQVLQVTTVNERGMAVDTWQTLSASDEERIGLRLGASGGVYLLQVKTPSHNQTIKLIKH